MTRGKFITLEGGEGAGKSSNVAFLQALIERAGHNVITTREPGGTPLAEAIRDLVFRDFSAQTPAEIPAMPAMTELLLMFAARSAHIVQRIVPALEQGTWVICDRFTDASYAYQGVGRDLGVTPVATLEKMIQSDLRPDCVLLFDLPVDVGLARTQKRSENNRFDAESLSFHEDVRRAYLDRAAEYPERYTRIDAALKPDQVQAQVEQAIKPFL